MIPKLKTIPQLIAEVTAEQPSILPTIDKLYDCMKNGSIHVYMVYDVPLLNQTEVKKILEF